MRFQVKTSIYFFLPVFEGSWPTDQSRVTFNFRVDTIVAVAEPVLPPGRRKEAFNKLVYVCSARPSQLFFDRELTYSGDFEFAEPLHSALKNPIGTALKPSPKRTKTSCVASRLLVLAVIGYWAIASFSSYMVPVCCVSLGSGFKTMTLAADPVPVDRGIQVGIVTFVALLIWLNLLSCDYIL